MTGFCFCFLMLTSLMSPTEAINTYTVTTTSDSPMAGKLTLRQALSASTTASSLTSTINFDPTVAGQTIYLTNGSLPTLQVANSYITIDASGGLAVTIDANHTTNIFLVDGGVTLSYPAYLLGLNWVD